MGGVAQERYEELRRFWTDQDAANVLGLVRLRWGQRLVHFGVLGLLDEDPTSAGWFGSSTAPLPAHDWALRCVRVLLGAEDVALREAYRRLLGAPEVLTADEEVG